MIECSKNRQRSGNGGNRAQSSLVSFPDKDTPRGATSGTGGGTNRSYALNNRQEHQNSPYIVTGIVQVFDYTIYAFLDQEVSLSSVTPYVAMN